MVGTSKAFARKLREDEDITAPHRVLGWAGSTSGYVYTANL